MTDSNTTPFFGLQTLPANATPEQIEQFAVGDRILIDRLIHHLATEVRFDGSAVGSGDPPETAEVTPTIYSSEGYLPAGRVVYYRWTRVSAAGIESLPSTPVGLTLPSALTTPAAPAVSYLPTGGSCYPGTWVYAVTAYKGAFAFDTPGSVFVAANLEIANGDEQQVIVGLPPLPDGADGLNLYRQLPNSTLMQFLATIPAVDCGDPFFDTGGPSPIPEAILTNRDGSAVGAKVRLTPAAPVPVGEKLRFYRQFGSGIGQWSQTFIGEMDSDDEDGWFEDLGGPALQGSPPNRSFAFTNPPKRVLADETEGILPANRVDVIDIVDGTDNDLPVARLDGVVPYAQIQAHLYVQAFCGEGPATTGIPTEWVVPFSAVRPNGLTISVPIGSAALVDDLIVELEVHHPVDGWVGPVSTITLPQGGDTEATMAVTAADLILGIGYAEFPAGTRFRMNVAQDGGAEDVTVQLAMAAKQTMAAFDWS